ncbi:DUF6157 family protein [Singulisphaera sp. PoT]|uniref:DUF6157 family protein n=1 Tax=Singulisphaera sp. PoT TaxID=3411797 RepID=UPI003BF5D67C
MKDMGYKDAFIQVATDCTATTGVVPPSRGGRKSVPVYQYELLAASPYQLTHADLLYEVHVRHKEIAEAELEERGDEIRAELLEKPHPCLRASALGKTYGWGVHYDEEGRIALYAVDSDEYRRFSRPGEVATLVRAMRTRREGKA